MPRIRQYATKYANEDFQAEVRQRQGFYNVMTITALAEHIGIPRSTLGYSQKEIKKSLEEESV